MCQYFTKYITWFWSPYLQAWLNFISFQYEIKNWKLPECGPFKNRIGFNFHTYSAVLLLKTATQLRALKIISAKRESFGVKNRSIICHLKAELLFVIIVISFQMIICHTSLNTTYFNQANFWIKKIKNFCDNGRPSIGARKVSWLQLVVEGDLI